MGFGIRQAGLESQLACPYVTYGESVSSSESGKSHLPRRVVGMKRGNTCEHGQSVARWEGPGNAPQPPDNRLEQPLGPSLPSPCLRRPVLDTRGPGTDFL